MSDPENRIPELYLQSVSEHVVSESKKYGGRTSLMMAGINLVSGAFVTDCLLHISGKAESMTPTEQALTCAAGGLVAATAILRRAYKYNGINLGELAQWKAGQRQAIETGQRADQLASWYIGPAEPTPGDDAAIDRFRAELDNDLN